MTRPERFGYLLVHFVEDQVGHGERIYFSLSAGDDPLRWQRLNGGEPVLESLGGTRGVRDPHLVRGPHGFHLIATDLLVWRPEGPDWWAYRHRGSRDIVVWDSPDLLTWSEPRYVTVAPESAGMAWAPEALYDPIAGDFLLHFSAGLGPEGDPERRGEGHSQIMVSRTKDFRTFSEPQTYLERPAGVIDMTVHVTETHVHRFAKQGESDPGTERIFHQVGSGFFAEDFRTVASNIGQEIADNVEGPLIFRANNDDRWYLWVDQYSRMPQGYHAYTTTDLAAGEWERVTDLDLPDNTKHGVVLPLLRGEYDAIAARWATLGDGATAS